MKTQQHTDDLKPGKGMHAPLSDELIEFAVQAMADIKSEWDLAEDETEFWKSLTDKWGKVASTEKFGDKTWIGFPIRGQEFRVGITRNNQGVLALDLRLWWS